jgi:hypothetical protein
VARLGTPVWSGVGPGGFGEALAVFDDGGGPKLSPAAS